MPVPMRRMSATWRCVKGSLHIVAKPGDHLPLTGIEAVVVSSAGAVLTQPLEGAVRCAARGLPTRCAVPRRSSPMMRSRTRARPGCWSTLGKFRFLDVGT